MAAPATVQQADELLEDESLAEEKLLEELENEEIPAYIREARLGDLKRQADEFKDMRQKDHGVYTEIPDEKSFLDLTTSEKYCVVHFFHEDFRRCSIADTHLQKLTEKYFETKFAKINVEKAKFLVEKLKIRVLPAILCFRNAVVVDRIVGFEDLGSSDSFPTEVLERRLAHSGVIEMAEEEKEKKTIFGFKKTRKKGDDSSDDDDDGY